MTRSERFLGFAVGAVALVWGWTGVISGYEGPYDEGNTLCAATRALAGEVPYRDFWSLHPPGTAWLLAGAFRAFGVTLDVERAVKMGVVALAAVLVYLLARLAARAEWAAAAGILFIVLPTQTLSLRSRDTGLVLVLATLLAAHSPSLHPGRRAIMAGFLAGLTLWFKQDFAAVAGLAGAVAVAVPAFHAAKAGRKVRTVFREALVPFGAGLVVAPLALAATLASTGSFGEFVRQAVVFPATVFGRVRRLTLGFRVSQLGSALASGAPRRAVIDAATVPLLAAAALAAATGALVVGGAAWRRGPDRARPAALLSAGLAALLLLAGGCVRADLEHLNSAVALALVGLVILAASRGEDPDSRAGAAGRASAAAVLAAVALLSLAAPAGSRGLGLPDDLVEAARFVAARSRPLEPIFVGNDRHDRLAYNAPLVYFLADRPNATRYDNLHPGVATTRPVQEDIVRALEASGVRWVVLWDAPFAGEPNESSVSSGVVLLDEWIARRAREAARFGSFRVLEVRPPAAPSGPR